MFITKDKTNWALVIAVAFLAGAVGGGLMLYIGDTIWQSHCLMQALN